MTWLCSLPTDFWHTHGGDAYACGSFSLFDGRFVRKLSACRDGIAHQDFEDLIGIIFRHTDDSEKLCADFPFPRITSTISGGVDKEENLVKVESGYELLASAHLERRC